MDYKDYYKTLGIARDASAEEVKRAYRRLARKYHPDVSTQADAEERFRQVSEAYEVLRDPQRRAAYDQVDPSRPSPHGFGSAPGRHQGFDFGGGSFSAGGASQFSDFFESLFGRGFAGASAAGFGTANRAAQRGEDRVAGVTLDLEDAFTGGSRTISQDALDAGVAGGSFKLTIPKGVRSGQKLRLKGKGSPGTNGAPAGDLYLEVQFRPHPYFRIDGNDLILDLPVAPWEAALGATVKAPTPAGPVDLKIPAGSNGGRRLRLKGRGMPGKMPGDLYAIVTIRLPPGDFDDAREFYERMAERMPFNPRSHLGV